MILGHRPTFQILEEILIGSHSPHLVASFGPSERNLYISTTDSDGTQPVVTESSSRPSVSVTCMSRSQLLDSDEGVSTAVVLVRLRLLV